MKYMPLTATQITRCTAARHTLSYYLQGKIYTISRKKLKVGLNYPAKPRNPRVTDV